MHKYFNPILVGRGGDGHKSFNPILVGRGGHKSFNPILVVRGGTDTQFESLNGSP